MELSQLMGNAVFWTGVLGVPTMIIGVITAYYTGRASRAKLEAEAEKTRGEATKIRVDADAVRVETAGIVMDRTAQEEKRLRDQIFEYLREALTMNKEQNAMTKSNLDAFSLEIRALSDENNRLRAIAETLAKDNHDMNLTVAALRRHITRLILALEKAGISVDPHPDVAPLLMTEDSAP